MSNTYLIYPKILKGEEAFSHRMSIRYVLNMVKGGIVDGIIPQPNYKKLEKMVEANDKKIIDKVDAWYLNRLQPKVESSTVPYSHLDEDSD